MSRRVPFNITQLAAYVEGRRALASNVYDAWLDFREIMHVGNLTELSEVLRADRVPFGVWSRPQEGTCSIYLNVPRNGIAIELWSEEFGPAASWLGAACAAHPFDLCASN